MHYGAIALAKVETAGIRIDVPYMHKAIEQVGEEIQIAEEELKQDEVWKVWKKRYAGNSNLGSRKQLGEVLFNVMKIPCAKRTKTGRPSTDEKDMEILKHPFIISFLETI